jgi:predicted component of type VI protein secretion system
VRSYFVGRSERADIVIADADNSVENIHIELIEDSHGKYYILDYNSINGTFCKQGGRWLPIEQACVKLDEPLLLGKYQTSVRKLLAMRAKLPQQRVYVGIQRDPKTGEIIPRRH